MFEFILSGENLFFLVVTLVLFCIFIVESLGVILGLSIFTFINELIDVDADIDVQGGALVIPPKSNRSQK